MEGGGLFATSMLKTIGNTPLIRIGKIYAKLETTNPTGSIKDRLAWYLIKKAEERGELKPGNAIIEVTSGNTGISLAMISAIRGYHFTAVMPESVNSEKWKMMESFGAEIILTPAEKEMAGAVEAYEKIVKRTRNVWMPRQFENPDNIAAHRDGISREIIRQMKGKVDAFVAGVGTGGTLLGVASALKEINSDARIVAVEPIESAVLSGGKPGCHRISGIGEGFIPQIVKDNRKLIDEIITMKSRDAIAMSRELARKHGILVGISSGANVLAARKIIGRYRNVVTVLPDRGERYLSVG